MPDPKHKTHGTQPPPMAMASSTGHPLPRRASPENSVTLRHHRLARDASMKPAVSPTPKKAVAIALPRRNSSNESHDTGHSDARNWFDHSNENAMAPFSHAMDVDPPFFQKETDSSNEDISKEVTAYPFHLKPDAAPALKPNTTHSSSADDYRSVIDDLTVEIQRLKEELKRYKQLGPDMLKREKLFEIKVHGLPKRKKRELEATLREFAAGLEGTPSAEASSARKKSQRHSNNPYSGSGSMSKHASSSSGSHSRPADSAYASMSTGPNSSGTSLGRPSMSSRARSSEQKVESYLKDIPEGLYPRHMAMTDKERKKLVVRRLEQLFTGKMGIKNAASQVRLSTGSSLAPVVPESGSGSGSIHLPPSLVSEPAREARIHGSDASHKKPRSRDNESSNSHGDQTESGGNDGSTGEANTSPPNVSPPEQRPTRVRDLDPDRTQVPSENMDYIRHLGLIPPELLVNSASSQDVSPDADGWVYLNLLGNLAQLHMFNVTPDFIRSAVSEKSTKFQLSPDRRKIRWRGGMENTKFSSDSSGDNSHPSPSADDTDGSNKEGGRKKQKTKPSTGDDFDSAHSGNNPSKIVPQLSGSSQSFHYKPLFVRQSSSAEQTSTEDTGSSLGPVEESNVGESKWGMSGSGSSQRRKRRLDGAIIYYSGAPFCTDLSGDPGDISPVTYMASTSKIQETSASSPEFIRPALPFRTSSGSALRYRPLSDENPTLSEATEAGPGTISPGLTSGDTDDTVEFEADFPWSDSSQNMQVHQLEPCGLGGVLPDDHFMVVVTTKRSKDWHPAKAPTLHRLTSDETTESIINRLATMSTSSPRTTGSQPQSSNEPPVIGIEYMSGRIRRLAPVALPPPTHFFPSFSTNTSESADEAFGSEADDDMESSEEFMSRRVNPHQSDNTYPDNEDITSGDEEGEEPDDDDEPRVENPAAVSTRSFGLSAGPDLLRRTSSSAVAAPGTTRGRSDSVEALPRIGSSVATAGGAVSDCDILSEQSS